MSRLFSPLTIRLLAAFLLILDLSQEPASALPVSPSPASDSDTVADLSTKEAFWWDSAAEAGHELAMALQSGQSAIQIVRRQIPPRSVQTTPVTEVVALCATAPSLAAFLLPPAMASPINVTAIIVAIRSAVTVHHRNSTLAHRRNVVLTV